MDISSRDESDSANFARLQKQVDELAARVGPDLLEGADFQDVPQKKHDTKALQALLKRRADLLGSLDAGLGQFVDAFGYLLGVNAEIAEELSAAGAGRKRFRPDLDGMAERALILDRLGEVKIVNDRRLDRTRPTAALATLAAIHGAMLAAVNGDQAEPQTPPVALTRITKSGTVALTRA